MPKDIAFHHGPRNCGKSIFVEKELTPYPRKLYIATLPLLPVYKRSIDEHVKRRGSDWITVEVGCDFIKDTQHIINVLQEDQSVSATMIDGLITWFLRIVDSGRELSGAAFSEGIARIVESKDMTWRLVDVNPWLFTDDDPLQEEYKNIHRTLINLLNIHTIIDWRYEQFQYPMDR